MFFWQIMITWTILVKGQKERFLPSINEIGPVVSDKKIFKVFYIYRENKPRPLAAMFFDKSWRTILVEDHQGNIFA